VIKFYGFEAIEELAIDENERAGNPRLANWIFAR